MMLDDFTKDHHMTLADIHSIRSSDTYAVTYNLQILHMKDAFQSGDQCWHYCSKEELWAACMGSEGYLLVRDNVIIDRIVSRMN